MPVIVLMSMQMSTLTVRAGRPLVLIIGSGATASDWTPDLLKNLAQQRPVVIFDNP